MDLNQLTIQQTKEGLKKRVFSCHEIIESCLSQIKKIDKEINAFVTITPDQALKEAKKVDNLIKKGLINNKQLFGIPVAVKDNYCTQGVRTTASAKVLDKFIPPYNATVWQKVKDAGAILLGKTNMDAWAHGSSTETSDYGTTKNPWDKSRLPGGSSGGSAAAVSSDETVFALGSETAGSIRGPAAWCGTVGLKPTYGRASRYGLIAMGSSLDCPGPITKTVADAALVLNVISGKDEMDTTTANLPVPDYTKVLGKPIKNLKIGFSQKYFDGVEKGVTEKVKDAMQKLEEIGTKIVEIDLFDPQFAIAVYTIIQRSEVSSNLARYDGIRYGNRRDFFGQEAKRRIMLGTHTLSAGYYDAYYLKAEKVRSLIIQDFKKAFQKVDCIVGPTLPSIALPLGSSYNNPMFGEIADVLVEPSSIAGLPGISIPCGFAYGLPVGMQIIGPQFSEAIILQLAYAYEQITDWHKMNPKL